MGQRTEKITFRVTPEEYKIINEKLSGSNYKMSELIRSSVLGKEIIIIDGVKDLSRELKAIGNNINQITILARKGLIKTVGLDSVNGRLEELWQLLNLLTAKTKK